MADLSFLKNPIILAVIATIITYLYIYWQNDNKYKKNPDAKKKDIDFMTPSIVGVLTWFIASSYFDNCNLEITPLAIKQNGGNMNMPTNANVNLNGNVLTDKSFGLDDNNSFHLITKNNIKLPQTDVFIDIAKF
jgi:archaellum component FlaF (FlaF/FlaG flagellin family)